jgi:hypothetical protein
MSSSRRVIDPAEPVILKELLAVLYIFHVVL